MVVLGGFVMTAGCSGPSGSTEQSQRTGEKVTTTDPALEALDPAFTVMQAGDRYSLSMQTAASGPSNSPSMVALRSIRSVTFQIYSSQGNLLDELTTEEVTTSGVMSENGESSLTGSAGISWEGNPGAGAYAQMIVRSDKGAITRRANFPAGTGTAAAHGSIDLDLELEDRGPGVEFILRARRTAPGPDGEYLPSGEQFRIEIQNDVGETIWSSSTGRAFTQSTGPVEPDEVGEEKVYRIFWDGRSDLSRTQLTPGRYRIVARIPARPQPYMLREELNWSGN